ncbi:MAG: CBS domain-containing protein [Pseudomonadota bacterium]|nr:CBS domain-containing protein [Pseudomonadota bacterium]
MTTVSQIMTRGVRSMRASDNIVAAAQAMEELNVGVIPVCDGDRLIGMVTDRDIIVRGVAQERDAKTTRLADVMSTNVRTVHEDEDVQDVLSEMADSQIRRIPVVDDDERLIGIVSLGDIAAKNSGNESDVAMSLEGISSPAEPDRSHQSQASGTAGGGSASGQQRTQPG